MLKTTGVKVERKYFNKECKREDFDLYSCKGCGVCAKVCPFKAIEMK